MCLILIKGMRDIYDKLCRAIISSANIIVIFSGDVDIKPPLPCFNILNQ